MEQERTWTKLYGEGDFSHIIRGYNDPDEFQVELASLINDICAENGYSTVIEVGCGTGITSMLLRDDIERTFFDLDGDVIYRVRQACERLNLAGSFIVGDMFCMDIPDKSYDVVFNSGVMEHFDTNRRIELLHEYRRVLKDQGTMVLAIPNHYSLPYRSAYLLKRRLLRGYQWPWPAEYRIYDLREELKATDLELERRIILARETPYHFWRDLPFSPVRRILLWSNYLFKYEGYLTTLVIRKAYNSATTR